MNTVSYRLHFPHLDREIAARENETIFQSARRHGVRIVGACGGRGTCGSCVVRVHGEVAQVHGQPDAIIDDEQDPAHKADRRKWLRACQLSARSDCTVEVAPRSLAPVVRAETDTGEREMLPLATVIRAQDITVPAATLQDNLSDIDRVLRGLVKEGGTVDLEAARLLPGVLRATNHAETWSLRAVSHGNELIHFAPAGRRALGLAIDLGTTNAAGFLVDLETGERLASLGVENP
jgi:uncharacterized 2Fe-2S/4Fe-4S cluster protein (DUF4445 family)